MSAVLLFIAIGSAPLRCEEKYPARAPASARAYFNTFDADFLAVGRARNVDPALLKAIAYCESRLYPCATSPAGALGLMQFMPKSFAAIGTAAAARDPFDPKDAIRSAGLYVAALTNYWRGDLTAIVASYNAGPSAVWRARKRGRKIPNIEETIAYTGCVTETHAWLKSNNSQTAEAFAAAQKERMQ